MVVLCNLVDSQRHPWPVLALPGILWLPHNCLLTRTAWMAGLRMYDGVGWLIFSSLSFILFQDPIMITVYHVCASWRPRNFACGMYRAAYGTLELCSCRYSRKVKALIHSLVSVILTFMLSFPFLLFLFQDPITITVYHVCASWRPAILRVACIKPPMVRLGYALAAIREKLKPWYVVFFPLSILFSLAFYSLPWS